MAKRRVLTCNRCTVEFYWNSETEDESEILYCDECRADYAGDSRPSEWTPSSELNQSIVDILDEEQLVDLETVETSNTSFSVHTSSLDFDAFGLTCSCLVCEEDLVSFESDSLREEHISNCLNSWQISFLGSKEQEVGLRSETFFCVICDTDMSRKGLLGRSLHLKKCAKTNKITTKDLLKLIEPMEEILDSDNDPDAPEPEDTLPDQLLIEASAASACKPVKNAWEVLMAGASSLTAGFNKQKRSSSLPSQRVPSTTPSSSSSSSSTLTRTTSSRVKDRKKGDKDGDFSRPQYVPAYKKVQSPGMAVPIVVDGFQFSSKSLSDCYFLTHFHSDHYTGLSRSFSCGAAFHSMDL